MRAPDPGEIARRLALRTRDLSPVVLFDRTGSTQDEARRLAVEGAPAGALVLARQQAAGRGRTGREWASPVGGLYASLVLRPEGPTDSWPRLAVVAGVAVVEAVRALGVTDACLKWPNDCRVGGRKLAGLLSEAIPEAGAVVLGVGLNLASVALPADVAGLAVSLEDLLPGADPDEAGAAVLAAVASACRCADPALDPDRVAPLLWTRERVQVAGVEGRVAGVTPDGALLLDGDDGRRIEVRVGEVDDARNH